MPELEPPAPNAPNAAPNAPNVEKRAEPARSRAAASEANVEVSPAAASVPGTPTSIAAPTIAVALDRATSHDAAGEDFLFHLYRGGELLHDNRVHDAKIELEKALALQPNDPKGQDLLAIACFRLGLFPQAIAIFEGLVRAHPSAIEPRINLALAYLKTAQPARASVELERVLDQNPTHSRAWGYYGLALQRLGDLERASQAFVAGGHESMAQRVLSMSPPASSARADFHELGSHDGVSESLSREGLAARAATTTWRPIEPGRSQIPSPGPSPQVALAPDDVGLLKAMTSSPRASSAGEPIRIEAITRLREPALAPQGAPKPASALVRGSRAVFPEDRSVSSHPSGSVLVRSSEGFAARASCVRSAAVTSETTSAPLTRRTRGRVLDEPLGGAADPILEIKGRADLILHPAAGLTLRAIVVRDEPFYLREELLCGFDRSIHYENGRLPVDDGDAIPMVQLRGSGTVVAALPESVLSVDVGEGRRAIVRARCVLGWTGRVVPRPLAESEPLGGSKGLVALAGEGMVLLDGR